MAQQIAEEIFHIESVVNIPDIAAPACPGESSKKGKRTLHSLFCFFAHVKRSTPTELKKKRA
jgi:hypothetical protein